MVLNNSKNSIQYEIIDGYDYIYTEKSNLFRINDMSYRYTDNAIKNDAVHRLTQIVSLKGNKYILDIELDELVESLSTFYTREIITLQESDIDYEKKDQSINLGAINKRYYSANSTHLARNGSIYSFTIPVFGHIDDLRKDRFFRRQKPHGVLKENFIEVKYFIPDIEAQKIDIQEMFDSNLELIKIAVIEINKNIEEINLKVKPIIKECIIKKQEEIRPLEDLKKTIKYPLKKNAAVPETFPIPLTKKEIKIPQINNDIDNIIQEPIIDLPDYNHILKICSDMALVMERTPSVFEKIDEEDLRIHFLVQLNGHYEGTATGETFNLGGKTDILIRKDNNNLFIGECKYWHGQKQYSETIDQLLNYVTYRDTKTAILVFVRNKDFSNVLNEIQETTPKHENFVQQDASYHSPISSAYRYVLKNKNDKDKKFLLTVMAFHIPEKQ